MALASEGARRRRRARRIAIWAAALCALAGPAAADPTNYQRYIIGERALGMGGAQTAAVNDPMASLYNPAGLVFVTSSMVSASMGVYSLDYRRVEGGFVPSRPSAAQQEVVDAETLEYENDLSLPSTLALVRPFGRRLAEGGPRRHAVGIAVLVPYQDSFTLKARWESSDDPLLRDRETYRITESHRQVWTGLSYAIRVNEELGLGIAAFLANHDYRRDFAQTRFGDIAAAECQVEDCGFLQFWDSTLSTHVVSILFSVGAMWRPHENWTLGLMVNAPSIKVDNLVLWKTRGKLEQTFGLASVDGSGDDRVEYYTDAYDLEVASYEPAAIRAGAAFGWAEQFVAALDASFHLPVSYTRIRGDPVLARRCPEGEEVCDTVVNPKASPYWFDQGVVRRVERRPVVNLNAGWELIIDETWTLRNGLFTDFSSAPHVVAGPEPQLPRVDRYGATLSVGWQSRGYDIAVGLMGAYGRGFASVHNPGGEPDDWRPAPMEERALYVFVSGIQKAVVRGAKQAYKKVEERVKAEERTGEGGEEEDAAGPEAEGGAEAEGADAPAPAGDE
jgi:hypothetical protein